jgi:Flp pilus assembly pilin Flp
MRKHFITFWRDDSGAVSPEWMLMATVLVLGSVAVLAATKLSVPGSVENLAKAAAGM